MVKRPGNDEKIDQGNHQAVPPQAEAEEGGASPNRVLASEQRQCVQHFVQLGILFFVCSAQENSVFTGGAGTTASRSSASFNQVTISCRIDVNRHVEFVKTEVCQRRISPYQPGTVLARMGTMAKAFKDFIQKSGVPFLVFLQEADPFAGFRGFVNLARQAVGLVSAPVWRLA